MWILAILLPSIATAQFFAKQKVVVWAVMDRNNDVKVSQGVKTEIQQYLIEALSSSYNYQPYEGSLASVEAKLTAQGLPEIPSNVAKVIKSVLKVDYVIFTTVKIMNHSTSYNNFDIHLTSEFYSTETLKGERMAYVDMKSDMSLIPSKCQELASKLLGENLTLKNSANQTQQQSSNTQSRSYSQTAQTAEKTYKVGDYYDVKGRIGVVFVVTPDGKHGKIISANRASNMLTWVNARTWCSNLGRDWRLPTREELLVIYKNRDALNLALVAMGDKIPKSIHWSSSEYDSYMAWSINMDGGYTDYGNKNASFYVRAVSAF